jgi:peroxiredoxin
MFVAGIVALLVLVLVLRPQPRLLAVGTSAPPILLQSVFGQQVNALNAAAHHNLVVEFFDTQCDTCQRQAGQLCAVAQRHESDVFVAVDAAGEDAATLNAYARARQPSPCRVTLLVDPKLSVSRAYRAAVVPTVYVVDSSGKIAYGAVGSAGVDGVDTMLQRLDG